MKFAFGEYIAEIDVAATREYYRNDTEIDCKCGGCTNFRKFTEGCSEEIKKAFSELGIDNMKCVLEIIPSYCTKAEYEKNGGNLYEGFFPVVGKVLGDASLSPEKSTRRVTDKFEFYLADGGFKPDDFPKPTFLIWFEAWIPWLIEAENDYVV